MKMFHSKSIQAIKTLISKNTKSIEKDMMKLYLKFYLPQLQIDLRTGKTNLKYVWTDNRAKELYEMLQSLILKLQIEQLRQYYTFMGYIPTNSESVAGA